MELTLDELHYIMDALNYAWMYTDLNDETLPPTHDAVQEKVRKELLERARYEHREK